MRIRYAALILTMLGASSAGYAAQAAPATAVAPSDLLQPSRDAILLTMGALKTDKWKKGPARDEAIANISSILHDLQSTLPPVLREADAAPRSMSKLLPVTNNIDSLYVVLLRTFDLAQVSAPADQVTQVEQALTSLQKGRRAFEGYTTETAAAAEKQIADLQIALKTQPVPVCPAAAPPPPAPAPEPAPEKKPVRKRKPVTAAPGTTPPAGMAKPQ